MRSVLRRTSALCFGTLVAVSGCSTLTNRTVAYPPAMYRDAPPKIEAAGKPLDKKASERVLRTVVGGAERAEEIERLLAVEQAVTKKPLLAGNSVKLLIDGPKAYEDMFAAIERAKGHIHLETYILSDDRVGRRLAKILLEKRKKGVEVRIIYDAYGSENTSSAFFDHLRDGGVQLHEFRPLNPLKEPLWKLDNRDHRKLLIVDGRVGFTGGMNVSGVYGKSSFAQPSKKKKDIPPLDGGWRDTHVRIEGPAVAELQHLFLRQWAEESSDQIPKENEAKYFPQLISRGDDLVRIIASEGGDDKYEIYNAYLGAIEHAQRSIWVTQAYFAPNHEMLEALEDAAKRGVDVRILVPGISDAAVVLNASRAEYAGLLKSGVRVFERADAMIHAKTAVIDGVWSTVGSSNFDYMSFLHNSEANAVIVSRDFGRQMEEVYRFDMAHAREIDPEAWRHRPIFARAVEQLSRLFTYWI